MKKYYCKCGNEIDRHTANYGDGNCKSCATKLKWQQGTFDNRNLEGENNPAFKNGLPHCIDCGKELKDYNSKRCKKCWYKFNIENNHSNFKGGKPKCIDCGKQLNNWYAERCIECFNKISHKIDCQCFICKSKRGEYKRENNPNWLNGISKLPYSFDFDEELKEYIRRRDNYICRKCGITEEEYLIVYGIKLSIHHIDYNKQNCNEYNLITLCSECNARVNFNRDYWMRFFKNLIKVTRG